MHYEKEYQNTKAYWRKYVKSHNGLKIKEPQNTYEERIFEIYKRSILLFPLLTNSETGAIIASPEIDEDFTKCGRYAYCWPRDAVFITKAMDILKMDKDTEKFYKVFCKKTQSKNGMWEQRFFTDGKLAPCWGYQVDETASVVYGVFEHYKYTKSIKFLKDNLQMCEKATDFLKRYVEDWLEINVKDDREKDIVKEQIENEMGSSKGHKYHISYDLWEMNEGIHLYSLASIYSAFDSMINIYENLGKNTSDFDNNRLKEEKINTCIDTSGMFNITEDIKEVLKYTDLVLLDIKHIDDEKCKDLVGFSNKKELEFARYLSENNKKMWIRQVLVPGYTDDEKDLVKLKEFLATLKTVEKVQILKYHSMGKYKWEKLGQKYELEGVRDATLEDEERAKKILGIE